MHILVRDPDANVVVLPADHYVCDEMAFAESLRTAARLAAAASGAVYLLGMERNEPDPELGYIVPTERARDGAAQALKFIEKPRLERASDLLNRGALWNAFIVAAAVPALVSLYEKRFAATVADMRAAAERDRHATLAASAASNLYERLPSIDFSRDVLKGQEALLRVLTVANGAGRIWLRRTALHECCSACLLTSIRQAKHRLKRRLSTSLLNTSACNRATPEVAARNIDRRLGHKELNVIEVCRAFGDAT